MDLIPGLTWATLAGFMLTSALIEITPGPNMVYLAVVAATDGRRPGFAAVAGVALGLAVVGLITALGVAMAINASPVLFQTLRWAGVVYLLYLAWDGWRDAGDGVEHAALGSSLAKYFGRGLVTNLLNPKAAAFYIAVLPGFVSSGDPVLLQTLVITEEREMMARTIAQRHGQSMLDVLTCPFLAFGTVEEICWQLVRLRDELGIGYVTVFNQCAEDAGTVMTTFDQLSA